MTQELVRQRRAALDAESYNERLRRDLQPQSHADPERRINLPVLIMAMDPASLKTGAAELNALLWGCGVGAVRRPRITRSPE